jgi:hypothetical protein
LPSNDDWPFGSPECDKEWAEDHEGNIIAYARKEGSRYWRKEPFSGGNALGIEFQESTERITTNLTGLT